MMAPPSRPDVAVIDNRCPASSMISAAHTIEIEQSGVGSDAVCFSCRDLRRIEHSA